MAIFDRQLNFLKNQLGGLETSQRVALGLCAVVVAGSILWLTQWSMQGEMLPLFTETVTSEELSQAETHLAMLGEDFAVKKGAIYVRPQDRRRLIMMLVESNVGPKITRSTFEHLIKNKDVFASEFQRRFEMNVALQNELAMTIEGSKTFSDASVFITTESKRKLGKPTVKPTASVEVNLSPGKKMTTDLVRALAGLVARAVPGLELQNVTISDLDTGRSYTPESESEGFGGSLFELQRDIEKELQAKIYKVLDYIPAVRATVTVKLDDEATVKQETKLGAVAPTRESTSEQQSNNLTQSQEPGVLSNTGTGPLVGGGSGTSHSEETRETEFDGERDRTTTQTNKRPGRLIKANASISIPNSYVVAEQEQQSKEPNTPQRSLDKRIEDLVKPILLAQEEPTVTVVTYSDRAVAQPGPLPSEDAEDGAGVMDFVSANIKQLGLAGLALLALGMMFQIVRKGGGAPVVSGASEEGLSHTPGQLGDLSVGDGPVGRAGSPDAFLIAQETDETSVRARQIAEQVSELVEGDPEGAAQLVRRWIEREM